MLDLLPIAVIIVPLLFCQLWCKNLPPLPQKYAPLGHCLFLPSTNVNFCMIILLFHYSYWCLLFLSSNVEVSSGSSHKSQGTSEGYEIPFGRYQRAGEAEGECKDCVHQFSFPESPSIGLCQCAKSEACPSDQSYGQANRPFSRQDQGCASVCYPCSALKVVVCQELNP